MLPCVGCGVRGKTQVAHSNLLRHGKGKSLKASDAAIMALCHDYCHPQLDQGGLPAELAYLLTMQYIADTYIMLMEAGLLEVAGGLMRLGLTHPNHAAEPPPTDP